MYCILVTGIPAAGKSTMAQALAEKMHLPLLSKDVIKERLFDTIGFQSRAEKVKLGTASMEILYYAAGQLMRAGQPFILENNFEYSSEPGIKDLLKKYQYPALTILLTGDHKAIYQRFLERENSPARHRGHIVNDCYPEKEGHAPEPLKPPLAYEDYVQGIEQRGFEAFSVGGGQIQVDTTDFSKVDIPALLSQIAAWRQTLPHSRP